jgi:K+-transporting ATPase ATPase C chain
MFTHIRACLILLVSTVLLCSVGYPLSLWAIGRSAFRHNAEGSLITEEGRATGNPTRAVGSRLIAQPFSGKEYFTPRPSAVSHNAAASGASNWGANNPLLRDRVARQLGLIAEYEFGKRVGPDVEKWFRAEAEHDAGKPVEDRFVVLWAKKHPAVAEQWIKDNADAVAAALGKPVEEVKNAPGDMGKSFFRQFAERHPGTWPTSEEVQSAGALTKQIKPVTDGNDVQAYLFDPWLQAHPDTHIEPVPADMVMASGSGLDPHITLKNALFQLDDVSAAWATRTKRDPATVRTEIRKLLDSHTESPLAGLAGGPLVNVLEMNVALRNHFERSAAPRN